MATPPPAACLLLLPTAACRLPPAPAVCRLLLPPASCLLSPVSGSPFQVLVKEICRSMIGAQPVREVQEIMYFIREDELLKLQALIAQALDQMNCFAER